MKRLIPIFLILVLLCGCGNAVKEFDLSKEYGIKISLPKYCAVEEGAKENKFSLGTTFGTLEFRKYTDSEKDVSRETVELFIENSLNNKAVEIKELENGAFFFSEPPYGDQEDPQYHTVEAYYFIQVEEIIWRIHVISTNRMYNEAELLTALQSIVFVNP